jgi:uncharacterized SAM-binding protein YcdF (DUF218 family)
MHESSFTPPEALRPTPFDAVIVLGCGVEEYNDNVDLGLDATWRTIAAAHMYQQGLAYNLVFTGGRTAGSHLPSEAQAMSMYLDRNFTEEEGKMGRIPQTAVYLEEYATDTSTNLINVKKLIEENNWQHVAILTNEYHLPRATKLATNLGLNLKPISAEKMLIEWDQRFQRMANDYYTSADMQQIQKTEQKLFWLLYVDTTAQIPRAIAKMTRK